MDLFSHKLRVFEEYPNIDQYFLTPDLPMFEDNTCCGVEMSIYDLDYCYQCLQCGFQKPYLVESSEWIENAIPTPVVQLYNRDNYLAKLITKFNLSKYREQIFYHFHIITNLYSHTKQEKRKSMISYNFILIKILNFIGVEAGGIKVPTKKTLKALEELWKQMIPNSIYSQDLKNLNSH